MNIDLPLIVVRGDEPLWLDLRHGAHLLCSTTLGFGASDVYVTGVQAQVMFVKPDEDAAPGTFVKLVTILPWQEVEQIAAYVRGDGSDVQRQALADGILEGRRA